MAGLVVALAVIATVAALGFLVLWLVQRLQRDHLRQRFQASAEGFVVEGQVGAIRRQLGRQGARLDQLFDKNGESEKLLTQAGWRGPNERLPYFIFQAALPLGLGAALVVAWMLGILQGTASGLLFYGMLALIIGLLAPRWLLRARASQRRMQLRAEVPMLIHLCALLFDAGLSLRQGLATLTRRGGLVLPQSSLELESILRQIESGAEVGEAMGRTARLLEVQEFASVLSVLQQVDRYGGELRAPLMDVLDVVEKRRELSLRERVNAMSGRMTVVMVLFFFPALLVFVAGPAFLSILAALAGAGR